MSYRGDDSDVLPLSKQLDIAFREIKDELSHLSSGIVFIQIRNNVIGKFGIKHYPVESKAGVLQEEEGGMSEANQQIFRRMAVDSLRHKKSWTHGEIQFEFALKHNVLHASVQFESNYNMANLFMKKDTRMSYRETV